MGKAAALTIIILFFTILYPADDAITILAVLWGFGMILIWKGLKAILPAMEITRFLRYALIGIWTAILPVFIKQR